VNWIFYPGHPVARVRAKIADLSKMESILAKTVAQCGGNLLPAPYLKSSVPTAQPRRRLNQIKIPPACRQVPMAEIAE
jgi:hypothetical protein